MNKLILPLFLLLSIVQNTIAQKPVKQVTIEFLPTFAGKPIELNKTLHSTSKMGNVEFSFIKFYVGHFSFIKGKQSTWSNEYYLVDVSNPESMVIDLEIGESLDYETIRFYLGVDSLTNTIGALGGNLDPTKGMYWAWQSGYINMKIEGKSDSIPTKSNEFQYHLGGFLSPYESIQTIQLNANSQELIQIEVDFEYVLQIAFQENYYNTMSPGVMSQFISKNAPAAFKLRK